MPITVNCPGCGRANRFKEELAGRTVSCKECGEDIEVDGYSRRRPGSRRGPRRRSSGSNAAVRWIVVGAVALAGVGLLIVAGKAAIGRFAGGGGKFAPGGQEVDAGGNPNPLGGAPAPSRFDNPTVGRTSLGGPGAAAKPTNPQAGVGLGSLVAVVDRWRYNSFARNENEYEILKEAPDALPPLGWDVEADPPKEVIDFSPSKKLVRVPIPKGPSLSRMGEEDVVFPIVASPFVSVGQNAEKKDVREIWDLTKPKKVGTITGLGVETEQNALSPDGRYFAGTTGRGNVVIGVWDVEEKKPLVDIPVNDVSSAHWIRLIGMPSSDRLIVFPSFGGSRAIVHELPSGEMLHSIDFGWSNSDALPVFSPGGKYFAWCRRQGFREQTISIYEVETGQVAGELTLPAYDISWYLNVNGIAFSPDGEELAAVMDGWSCSKIIIWRLKDGEIIDHMTYPKKLRETILGDQWLSFRTVNPLVWFPGKERLLAYEHGVIDRATGLLVWQIPRSNIVFGRKRWPLDASHVTVMSLDGQTGSVVVYKLPEDKISDATAKAAARVTRTPETPWEWVEQGPPAQPEWKNAATVVSKEVPWTVGVDPAPAGSGGNERGMTLPSLSGSIRQVAVSSGEKPVALVARSTSDVSFARIPEGNVMPNVLSSHRSFDRTDRFDSDSFGSIAAMKKQRSWIDVYDLSTGKRSKELRMKYDGDLTSVSPDGSKFLVLQGQQSNRLDVYKADGEWLSGWVPYNSEPGDLGRMLVAARFAGNDHVVTLSGAGLLSVFPVDGSRVLWSAGNASQPAVSAGGKYVGFSDGESYCVVDTATGALKGRIPDVGAVSAASFRPDGKFLALLSEHKGGYYLFTVDVVGGQVSPPFPVPVLSAHLRWYGDRYVLIDHRKLVDVEQKVVAWTFDLPAAGDHIPTGPDGQLRFIAPVSGKPYLGAAAIPGATALSQLTGATLQPEFVLQPGGSCSLKLDVAHPAITDAFRSELADHFRKGLAEHRISVADGQPVTLTVLIDEKVGETVKAQFQSFGVGLGGGGPVDVSYPVRTATCRVAFLVDGKPAWEEVRTVGNQAFFIQRKQNQSVEQAIQAQYEANIRAMLKVRLPPFVFTPRSANGIGATELVGAN